MQQISEDCSHADYMMQPRCRYLRKQPRLLDIKAHTLPPKKQNQKKQKKKGEEKKKKHTKNKKQEKKILKRKKPTPTSKQFIHQIRNHNENEKKLSK